MPQTLQEYADWLDNRNLIWPKVPGRRAPKATPSVKPLSGIRAVTWSVYGTLLRIADGRLLHVHPDRLRMQVALEKVIEEFNMWHYMSRKPGAPWEYLDRKYRQVVEAHQMAATAPKGEVPEVNSASLWRKLIERLMKNEYRWDEAMHGDLEDFSAKVAYYFHRRLQGVEAAEQALQAVESVSRANLVQGLLADGQPFTFVQLLRALSAQGKLPAPGDLFDPRCVTLSFQVGVRKPSRSLYQAALRKFQKVGIAPREILHVGNRLQEDLVPARRAGMRTALYAGDESSLEATKDELKDPRRKPDRLLTDLQQIEQVLGQGR